MDSTPQRVYATNLRQNIGYPLRNPNPNSRLGRPYEEEGLQIGDVGYVDDDGEFIWLFNIKFPAPGNEKLPEEFHNRSPNLPEEPIKFAKPVIKQALEVETVFMAGVTRNLEDSRATYHFTATSKAGAILILPDGATASKLEGKQKLDEFRQLATKYALQWCRYAQRDSLYLITETYTTKKSWTLGSFNAGLPDREILVQRQTRDDNVAYIWSYQFNVDHQQGHGDNRHDNQTVFIRGFKMTIRWDWFPVIEQAEISERWFSRVLATLWPIRKIRKWLSQTKIEFFPARNLSQPLHPLDIVNHVLLDKNPGAQMVVTHDDAWIEMLEKGLSHADLMQENRIREFMEEEYTWDLDSEHNAIYLRSKFQDTDCQREPMCDPEKSFSLSSSGDKRFAITNMRLENIDLDRIYAGVCILVQFGSTMKRAEIKPHASVIEWDDDIMLPSGLPIYVTVCGAFQLGSTLGTRKISTTQTINTVGLSGGIHMVRFSFGKAESCSSILITLGQHFPQFQPYSDFEGSSVFVEKTILGFRALYSHHDVPKKEYLQDALECFQYALDQYDLDSACRATALFNLATAKLIACQIHGAYSELNTPIELYGEALELRDSDDLDRPVTLLLLAQALLFRYGQEHDESILRKIEDLLVEIHPDGSRNRQTADTILRTCRFYQATDSGNPTEIENLLDRSSYIPPYGFFDLPHILHKQGVALWARFQLSTSLHDLDRSVALNREALHLIPDGHSDQSSIVTCLGSSLLKLLELREVLSDLNTSADLAQLGEIVITELDGLSSARGGHGASSSQKLRDQIKLMSAADDNFRSIVRIDPSQMTPEVHSLIDEWKKVDGTPTKCKRELGVLISFLRGEGETKMRELLTMEWPFKEFKIEETEQVLLGYMAYFRSVIASTLKWVDKPNYSAKHLHQRRDIIRNWLFKEERYTESHGYGEFVATSSDSPPAS